MNAVDPGAQSNEMSARDVVAAVRLGCDRATAARCAGWTMAQLDRRLAADEDFRREIERSEAVLELSHLRNVQAAAKDEKNWRASVWWLERSMPARYGKRGAASRGPAGDGWAPRVLAAVEELLDAGPVRTQLADRIRQIAAAPLQPAGGGRPRRQRPGLKP